MHNQNMAKLMAKLRTEFPGKVLSKTLLRAEAELVNQQSQHVFDFKKNKSNPTSTEAPYLLQDNNRFVVLFYKFFLGVKDSTNPAIYVKQTFPNVIAFPADGAGGAFDPQQLEAFYNAGYLTYKKGDSVYMPALGLHEARFVGQTQQSATTNKTSTEHGEAGVINIPEPMDLIGTDAGEFYTNLPSANLLTGLQYTNGGTKKVVAILEAHGVLVSGGNKISAGVAL